MKTLIPTANYHALGVFVEEQDRLFSRHWICVGFQRDVARHNDFLSRDVGGRSIVVHNFDGELRAFYNVCSHRFNRIHCARSGNRPLQCAYHGWTYDASGLPTVIPKRPRFDELTPDALCALRLGSCRVEVCGQLVFVCRAAEGPNLRQFLGETFSTLAHLSSAFGPQIDENIITIQANWKVLVENTLESYHVGFVHPNTFSRLNAGAGKFEWHPPHSSWETPLGENVLSRMNKALAPFASRPVKLEGYVHQLIFPNLTLASTQGVSFSVQFFEPVSSSETRFTSVVFQTRLEEELASSRSTIEMMNGSVKNFNRAVFNEDKAVCEQVQLGLAETERNGILSDEELRVGDFQKNYMQFMESPR